jgi:hypothetical protein
MDYTGCRSVSTVGGKQIERRLRRERNIAYVER